MTALNCPYRRSNPEGCPILVGNSVCGEVCSLDITQEFKRLYEERLHEIDSAAGGDCMQEKIKLQQEWIRNLTQQNDMLIRAVQELEYEATERVQLLEDKLQRSSQCLCEVIKKYREHDFTSDLLEKPLQKISSLEDDLKNVMEFIRRIRVDNEWNTDGLFFNTILKEDLVAPTSKYSSGSCKGDASEVRNTARLIFNQQNKPNSRCQRCPAPILKSDSGYPKCRKELRFCFNT